jgi:hypothetical protein
MERNRRPTEDDTATEPTEDGERRSDRHDKSEQEGGPYGNPSLDEETLRKKQEDARRRRQGESR